MSKNVQFVTDAEGHKTAVIIPIDDYEELLEDLHLGRISRESKDEERIPWQQIRAELVATGRLDERLADGIRSRRHEAGSNYHSHRTP
jgi:hypothetical protein